MKRVPVTIKRRPMRFHPKRFVSWVPRQRTVVVRHGETLTRALLAHELRHVIQAEKHSWPLAYLAQWVLTGFSYRDMPFEREARAAQTDPAYLAWADDLMQEAP